MTTYSESPFLAHGGTARLGLVMAAFALLIAPLGLLADKAVVPLALGAALAGGLALGRPARPWRVFDRPSLVTLGVLLAWSLLSTLWSPAPLEAAKLALRIAALCAALLYLVGLARHLDGGECRLVARSFSLGFAVAAIVIVVELAFDGPIFDLLHGAETTDYAADSRLNRGVSAIAILVWPLSALAWQQQRRLTAILLVATVFALTLFSQSSASMLAAACGLLAAAVGTVGRRTVRGVLALTILGALFATPPAIQVLQDLQPSQVDMLPGTAQYRLHIWKVVSERVAERPVLGWGFDASPLLPTGDAQPSRPGRKVIPSHPHNGGLQIMVELGLIGSLLALAFLVSVVRRIDTLPSAQRTAAAGMTVTILVVACTAYGIWQSHWLAVVGGAVTVFVALLPQNRKA